MEDHDPSAGSRRLTQPVTSTRGSPDLLGDSVDYCRAKLYGHHPLPLEDVMALAEAYGPQVLPSLAVKSFDGLLPK